jgi:hypothetical protein
MENIVENNKLIAEFLVKNEGGLVKLGENIFSTIDEFEIPDDYLTLKDLKYHKDWNWLMGVVEKIEIQSKELFGEYEDVIINGCGCGIATKNDMISIAATSKIEAVYIACIEFIKWYNEQKKNNESL